MLMFNMLQPSGDDLQRFLYFFLAPLIIGEQSGIETMKPDMQQTQDQTADGEMLRHFVTEGSQEAFAAIVRRYADIVHATCLRRLGGNGDAFAKNIRRNR